ncbi:hypothetical protein VKT23_018843 [Stygiomarasmius scandens]|uniref:C2H2-type domain-containing protein n=1 Tax=Marasmiellus scandens TaxID=2682957 RepID=A0ABR1IR30_9AGAR
MLSSIVIAGSPVAQDRSICSPIQYPYYTYPTEYDISHNIFPDDWSSTQSYMEGSLAASGPLTNQPFPSNSLSTAYFPESAADSSYARTSELLWDIRARLPQSNSVSEDVRYRDSNDNEHSNPADIVFPSGTGQYYSSPTENDMPSSSPCPVVVSTVSGRDMPYSTSLNLEMYRAGGRGRRVRHLPTLDSSSVMMTQDISGNTDTSRQDYPSQVVDIPKYPKQHVGTDASLEAARRRRKDPSTRGRYICPLCERDFTTNHNLKSRSLKLA